MDYVKSIDQVRNNRHLTTESSFCQKLFFFFSFFNVYFERERERERESKLGRGRERQGERE